MLQNIHDKTWGSAFSYSLGSKRNRSGLMGCDGPSRRGIVIQWSLPLQTCTPASLASSFLRGRVFVFGRQIILGFPWKPVSSAGSFAWSWTWVQIQEQFEIGWLGSEISPRYPRKPYSTCTGLVSTLTAALFNGSSARYLLCTPRVARGQTLLEKPKLNSFCFDAKFYNPHPCLLSSSAIVFSQHPWIQTCWRG